jgi:hypothetical protein
MHWPAKKVMEFKMVSSIQNSLSTSAVNFPQPRRALSDEQKQTVQDILSNYDASKVTASDAKSIFKAFEEAGIRGGGLREAISSAGFDADAVWSLAHDGQKPPQGPGGPGGGPGGRPGGGPGGGGATKVNSSALQALQSILNQYDFSNMTDDKEQTLISQLSDSGLLQTGSVINLSA